MKRRRTQNTVPTPLLFMKQEKYRILSKKTVGIASLVCYNDKIKKYA